MTDKRPEPSQILYGSTNDGTLHREVMIDGQWHKVDAPPWLDLPVPDISTGRWIDEMHAPSPHQLVFYRNPNRPKPKSRRPR